MDAFTTAWASLKAAADVLKIAVEARDDAKIKSATLDLREQLFDMSSVAMDYVSKNADLTLQVAELKLAKAQELQAKAGVEDWSRERERYVLHRLPTGTLVYQVDPAVKGPNEPVHYACQSCMDSRVKSILQPSGTFLRCPANTDHNIKASDSQGSVMPFRV